MYHKSRIKGLNSRYLLYVTCCVTPFFLVALPVLAVSWLPLVPCGVTNDNPDTPQDERKPCNQCDLLRLLKNIIDFVLIGLMPPAAAILFVWGGFLILMGGANPGWITQGKSIFWNTAIGVAIISSSWLITNTIIRSIAADNVAPEWWKFECRVTTGGNEPLPIPQPEPGPEQPPVPEPEPGQPPAPQPPGPQPEPPAPQPPVSTNLNITTISLSDARQDFNYSQTIQATGGRPPYNWSISGSSQLPSGLMVNGSTGEIFGKPTVSGNFSFTVGIQDSSSPVKQTTKQLSIKVVAPAASVVISNVVSSNITNTNALITWTTDKPSNSQVAYGTTTAYGSNTSLNSNQVTSHSVTITGLSSGTTYNYQAISSITGFTARSSNNTFKTSGQPPAPAPQPDPLTIITFSLPGGTVNQSYSQQLATTGGMGTYSWSVSSGTLPSGLSINFASGKISGTPTAAGTSTFTVKVTDNSTPQKSATKQLSINVISSGGAGVTYGTCTGVACRGDTTNVCGAVDPGDGCDLTAVNNLNAAIVSGVGNRTICSGVNTVKMLKTIIANESDGRIDIGSVDSESSGPFQLTPATAKRHSAGCGVRTNEVIDFSWLRRADTVSKQACIAAQFIQSFVGSCGCDIKQLAAGYNGGPTACAASNACGQQAAANGGQCSACNVSRPTRKWECLWEDTQHNSCNIDRIGKGYSHTRIYAPRVEYCYNRF